MASLFQACKSAVRNKEGGTFNIGGYDIDIEMYSQQDIDDDYEHEDVAFGDSDESKIVLVAGATITVPPNYILTPDSPKKSLVIYCNTFVNNGTISMYRKAPNVLPHDYYIIQGNLVNSNRNIIIPAYANNAVPVTTVSAGWNFANGINGNNGTNRNCGSGSTGALGWWKGVHPSTVTLYASGSGYAFGGGAGSGGIYCAEPGSMDNSVDATYPMRGSSGYYSNGRSDYYGVVAAGGNGNPAGTNRNYYGVVDYPWLTGCGGRIIIFCNEFTNNGLISADGGNSIISGDSVVGGASGGGAVDIFYSNLVLEGDITANGGDKNNSYSNSVGYTMTSGIGGNGSITFTRWNLDKVIKEERKMFTKNNWIYLFNNYSQRLREDVI